MAKVGSGFSDFIGTRPSPVDPNTTEFFNKQTNQGFADPGELAGFASTLGSGQQITKDNVFDVVGRGFTPKEIAPDQPPTSAVVPDLPQPQAGEVASEFFNSMTADLQAKRQALENAYNKELERVQSQAAESQKKIDELTAKQEEALGDVGELLTPFREELEKSERERLKVEENFFANQKLVNELDTLLTQGNEAIRRMRGTSGSRAVMSQSLQQTISDVTARAGVIQAVIQARNGQIAQAYNMIDRSVAAMTADKQDQLNYYDALLKFYGSEKDDENNRLIRLEKDERTFLNAKVGLLENDLKNAQATANYIKELMIDPETAKFVSDAGVTLNDSVDQINKKMAEQTQREEKKKEQEENRNTAFAAGVTTMFYRRGEAIVRSSDGFEFKDEKQFREMTGMAVGEAQGKGMVTELSADYLAEREQVQALMKAYPDAGIRPSDNLDMAEAKIRSSSSIYRKATRIADGTNPVPGKDGDYPTSENIKDWILSEKKKNPNLPYYDLWGMLADQLRTEQINPQDFDKEFWTLLHPEGEGGFNKYVKKSKSSDHPFAKKN